MVDFAGMFLDEPIAVSTLENDTPEWEATCSEYFGKIFDEPLHHFNVDTYSDLDTKDVIKEIEAYAAIGDTNEAYFDDRESFNIFETNS